MLTHNDVLPARSRLPAAVLLGALLCAGAWSLGRPEPSGPRLVGPLRARAARR